MKAKLKTTRYERGLKIPPKATDPNHLIALDRWDKDESLFWSSPVHTFIPASSHDAIRFILVATVQFRSNIHESCLQRRFLALFWLDYFQKKFPDRTQGFDAHYKDLAYTVSNPANEEEIERTVAELRTLVKAGRRYEMLVNAFGEGILLTLPSSIAKTL